jgi:amidohydrolase
MTEREKLKQIVEKATELRKELHRIPEVSGKENKTRDLLKEFFNSLQPDHFHENIGGNSIAWEFSGSSPITTLVLRADMDALPIHDDIPQEWASKYPGVGHKCGHDGHMAILAGFAGFIAKQPFKNTRLILLFQAEEETGMGAEKVSTGKWFQQIKPDYVFGLHNLPGFKTGRVILKEDVFASASVGMKIKLKGKSSHAGQPEDGVNPAMALAHLIRFVSEDINFENFQGFTLATIIHIRLGEIAFGTSPGEAWFMLTLRAARENDLEKLTGMIRQRTEEICIQEGLKHKIEFTEQFPSTVNHKTGFEMVREAASEAGLEIHPIDKAFRWSEDFGHYLKNVKGAFFGLGSGEGVPALHNPDYDFPDEIIAAGIKIFYQLFKKVENQQ